MEYEDILKKWQLKKIETVDDLDNELENFRILFAYHSNVIENSNITLHNTRETFENSKVVNYSGDLRTLFEIQNQKNCYDFLKEKILKKEPLKKELILEIHKVLMYGCYDERRYNKGERPGEFKKNEYIVGDDVGVLSEDVETEIEHICNEINSYKGEDILTVAAYLHLNFEAVHPFADGNGRVGRTIMNYFLLINNFPPMIIYEENKDAYYMALTVFDKTGNIDGFIKFLKEQTIKTWTVRTPNLSRSMKLFCF